MIKTFNKVLETRKVPISFKTGVLTPVLKKGKDSTLCESYRGITVTPTLGKTFEYSLLWKLKLRNKTDLQFGFTESLNPIMASLLMSEAKCEKLQKNENIVIGIMDVQSAFDVVQHKILLDKLLNEEINPILWLIIKDLYSGLSTKTKWTGGLSESFSIHQGIRQGGILSTHLYKIFVQDLLLELENHCLGFQLGDIYIGTPTCADDIAFIESNNDNLQVMLNTIGRYANQHHYNIHPKKTKIIQYANSKANYKWYLNDKELCADEDAVHLGLIRSTKLECDKNIESRIESARRTQYGVVPLIRQSILRQSLL